MKKLALIFFTLFLSQIIFAQKQDNTWDYPVKPGTEQWKVLGSYEKRLNAYNIPDTILSMMSTKELVKTCLNYPEFGLIISRNSLQLGYEYLKTIFNGFVELEKRQDSGKELIKVYELMEPRRKTQLETISERGAFAFQFTCIEFVMSQPEIQKKLSKEDIRRLLEIYINCYEEKISVQNGYSLFDIGTTVLVMARLLNQVKYPDFEQTKQSSTQIRYFMEEHHVTDLYNYNQICNLAKNYLKTL